MYKSKIKITLMILLLALLKFPSIVNAADTDTTYTATSTINDITVNWSYKLNESNEIEELICTNVSDITGDITIPSSIDGKNVVILGDNAFKSATGITGVEIPSTVKEIGLWAFSGCINLAKVDLGSVERICDQSFYNCTALTSIKIPKTLNKDAAGAPFSGCTNLKNIELEEGMTVVPNYVCASTPITEITIPSTVKEIGLWAFKSCDSLKKITILDNVENMEGYNSSSSDLIFQNHNEDLTIYCYKDSMAAKYAIKYNIKYVYLTKPSTGDGTNTNEDNQSKIPVETPSDSTQKPPTDNGDATTTEDPTTAPGKLPDAGIGIGIIVLMVVLLTGGLFNYFKYRNLRGI